MKPSLKNRRRKATPPQPLCEFPTIPPSADRLTTKRLAVAIARLNAIAVANLQRARGRPMREVYRATRSSAPSLCRWQQRYLRDGLAGLFPQTFKCGRKPKQKR